MHTGNYAHVVGNGTEEKRSNAHTLDWDGNAWFAGNVYVGGEHQNATNAKILRPMDPYVIDAEKYTFGDDALNAILEGRQIYVKVSSAGALYSNFVPVLQYQIPDKGGTDLYLFYLKDGIANNLTNALFKAVNGDPNPFDEVYGIIEMTLTEAYEECPLKVSEIKPSY